MGSNTSSNITRSTKTFMLDASNDISNENISTTKNIVDSSQQQTLEINNSTLNECGISLLQTATIILETVNEMTVETATDIANDISNSFDAQVTNAIDQSNSGIALGKNNSSTIVTETSSTSISDLSTRIANTVKNQVDQQASVSQDQQVVINDSTINCDGDTIEFIQNSNVEARLANTLESEQVTDIFNQLEDSLKVTVDNQVTQSNSGILPDIGGIISKLIGLLTGLVMTKTIIITVFKGLNKLLKTKGRNERRLALINRK